MLRSKLLLVRVFLKLPRLDRSSCGLHGLSNVRQLRKAGLHLHVAATSNQLVKSGTFRCSSEDRIRQSRRLGSLTKGSYSSSPSISRREKYEIPDTDTMNAVLEDWVESCKAIRKVYPTDNRRRKKSVPSPAEMLTWVDRLGDGVVPDTQTYSLLMDGTREYCYRDRREYKKHAREFLESLLKRMIKSGSSAPPNTTHFHKVMTANVRANDVPSAKMWLDRLVDLYREQDRPLSLAPTVDTFAIIIGGWSLFGQPLPAEGALKRLETAAWEEFPEMAFTLRPRRIHYASCINAWVKASTPQQRKLEKRKVVVEEYKTPNFPFGTRMNAGHRAENLYMRMLDVKVPEHEQASDVLLRFNCSLKILTCWVHHASSKHITPSERWYPTERATRILKRMLEMEREEQDEGSVVEMQDIDRIIANAYSLTIQAWCSFASQQLQSEQDYLETAQLLLSQLADRAVGDVDAPGGCRRVFVPAKAWKRACVSVMAIWGTRARRAGGGHQQRLAAIESAQAVFDHFEIKVAAYRQRHRRDGGFTEEDYYPDTNMYNELLHAHTRIGDGIPSEQLLRRMQGEHKGGKRKTKPDLLSFNWVMLAWSRSNPLNNPDDSTIIHDAVESLFREMKAMGLKPDATTYNALIASLSGTDKVELALKGEAYLRELLNLYSTKEEGAFGTDAAQYHRPSAASFNKTILLWASVSCDREKESEIDPLTRVQWMWKQMTQLHIKPDASTYQAVRAVVKSSDVLSAREKNAAMKELNDHAKRTGTVFV